MPQQPPPPSDYTAANQDVMAAIAAAMAAEEQAAAAASIQRRQQALSASQQVAFQAAPAPHALAAVPTPATAPPPTTADPFAAAIVPAQPGAGSTDPLPAPFPVPARTPAPPVHDHAALETSPMMPRSVRGARQRPGRIALGLVSLLLVAAGGGFLWLKTNSIPTTAERIAPPAPAESAAAPDPAPRRSEDSGEEALVIPIRVIPRS